MILPQTAAGGYGIRPYGAGGDACIDPAGVRQTGTWGKALSHTRCGGSPLAEGAKGLSAPSARELPPAGG